ncbi:hypothetical protein [Rhodococcus pyridinivorans]|uniref:hypothetical protein n=1 Tax=Rhodococcus pyridinivorans TaxID=103816 RepID=UPI00110D65F4|nr:hypothetical protein [Rhodococcus pyridinivorans]
MSTAIVVELPTAEAFWTSRPILEHLLTFARARRAGPWAVLGSTCARAVATLEPNVMLPPTVGAPASLNLFVALVGRSGGGKGAAEGASRDAVRFVDHNGHPIIVDEFPPGSGEGIARTFRPAGTDDNEPNPRSRALLTAPEVDTLTALGSRQGATLMPELRKVWMGEQLGFNNASKATRSILAAHSYRASLIVGVQPIKAGPLLDDADGGTPQRFKFLPVGDPDAPDVAPDTPEPFIVKAPRWGAETVHLDIPDIAREAMDRHRLATLRGEDVDPLDGHRMLARLKMAAALMILDGRTVVTDEDWHLAGVVTRVSDRTRVGIETAVAERARAVSRARAHEQADREGIVQDRAEDRLKRNLRGRILRRLEKVGGSTLRDLRHSVIDSKTRGVFNTVMADLLEEKLIVEIDGRFHLSTA